MGWRGVEGGGLFGGVGGVLREGCWVVDGLGWRGGWLERGRLRVLAGKGGEGWGLAGEGVGGWLGGWRGGLWSLEVEEVWVWLEGGLEGGLAGGG